MAKIITFNDVTGEASFVCKVEDIQFLTKTPSYCYVALHNKDICISVETYETLRNAWSSAHVWIRE